MSKEQQYGLVISSRGYNLGDDIQSYAASCFIPKIDFLIRRERISAAKVSPGTKVIINGWYMHNTKYWPPNQRITPLFISFHSRPYKTNSKVEEYLNLIIGNTRSGSCLDPKYFDYLARQQKIGCRDEFTCSSLRQIGIQDAYFSGCITLTLSSRKQRDHDRVVFVDPFSPLPVLNYNPKLWKRLPVKLRKKAIKLSHLCFEQNSSERLKMASEYIDCYSSSSLVVTSRLHAALPCLALGTPVIFINPNHRPERLLGYESLLSPVSRDEFIEAANSNNLSKVISNPDTNKLIFLKEQMISTISNFLAH